MLFRSKTAIWVPLQHFVRPFNYLKAFVVVFRARSTTLRVIAIIPINNLIQSIDPASSIERSCPVDLTTLLKKDDCQEMTTTNHF